MIELVKRMGLYDILAMLIPGYLIYLLVWGYLIGSSKLAYLSDFERTLLLVVVCYAVGIVWHKLMELVFRPLRNTEIGIELGRRIAYNESASKEELQPKSAPQGNELPIRAQYYQSYYRLAAAQKLGAVPTVESQIAFLQNTLFLLPCLFLSYIALGVDAKFPLCLCLIGSLILLAMIACKDFCGLKPKELIASWCTALRRVGLLVLYYIFAIPAVLAVTFSLEMSWAYFVMIAIFLVVYLLLTLKVHSMIWEGDAYYKEI